VRKLVIADTLAGQVGAGVFITPLDYGAPRLLFALVAYTFALYNDFAGYTDIVRGVSGLFGIRLAPNFLAPFYSRSFAEIWQRWHITLCSWLRDYIYLPLSRALLRRNPNPRAAAKLDPAAHGGDADQPGCGTISASACWCGEGWSGSTSSPAGSPGEAPGDSAGPMARVEAGSQNDPDLRAICGA